MVKFIRAFKGGSLSQTSLIKKSDSKLYVRKIVSLKDNREYGFQRWYSQLKKLQRYSVLFPGIFPKVFEFGQTEQEAYMDIEYFDNAINAQEFIEKSTKTNEIDNFFFELINLLSVLHKNKIDSCKDGMSLYIHEEIDQRIHDCMGNKAFTDFLRYDEIIFNGNRISSLMSVLNQYKIMCNTYYQKPKETFTHGNITLENMLYIPNEKRLIFIDPYEENIIDSELAEYSQILQSSNAMYELYNKKEVNVYRNEIIIDLDESFGLKYFNDKIKHHIKNAYAHNEYMVIRLLEISQFIRMLPFKMAVDQDKMILFYGLASYLFDNLKQENIYAAR